MANNQSFVNGTRIDSINYLNYLKLIYDKLYIGFLNRSKTAWGNAVLIGIDTSLLLNNEITAIKNIDLSGENYYIKLFNETKDTAGVLDETCSLWKLLRINDKWALIENVTEWIDFSGAFTFNITGDVSYTDYVKNLTIADDSYAIDIYQLTITGGAGTSASHYTATLSSKINYYDSANIVVEIRCKNIDSDFYNANKTVYLSSSGMTTSVFGFENLTLLENSKDNTSIKIVNVPDSIFAQIQNKTLKLDNRRFDVIDTSSNTIILKNIVYSAFVEFNDVKILKFTYSTSKGDKVVLATNNIYDAVYEIYPDYTIDLLTEMINDNLPPGIDYSYVIDNYVLDSLFIPDTEETFDYTKLVHWDFIKTCNCNSCFCSLANETNRLISGTNGYYLDNSVYVALDYDGNWELIKENNFNKLLLTFDLNITNSATAPVSPNEYDLWYDTNTGEGLKMFGNKVYANITSISTPDTIVINDQDLTDYILVGDDIILDGFNGEVTNNGTFEVESITYADGNTTIVTVEETLLTEAVDGTETITVENKWITMTNTDIRQLGVFYYDNVSGDKELIYLTNINKINPIGTISFQLII